jgi:outer membrane protein assembly factor BamA
MMKIKRLSILLFILLFITKSGNSQNLSITFSDIGKTLTYKLSKGNRADSLFIAKTLYQSLLPLYSKGYLAATIDSLSRDSINVRAFGYMGQKYRWVKIKPDSLSQFWLSNLSFRIPRVDGKIINPQRFARLTGNIVKRFEDSGYPFVRVKLDSIQIKSNRVDATLIIDRGSIITIDTLYLKGDAKIKHSFVMALLNLKKGELYSEAKIRTLDQRINQQPYIGIIKPTEVEFLSHSARLYCYLTNKSASHFSGLAGFYSDEKDGKIKLNGDLNLSLINTMHNGERINFAWNAPGKGTQNLNVETEWPYIFASQIGISGSFSLYKRDSSYISVNPKFSFNFYTHSGGRFLLNLDYKTTSLSSAASVIPNQYANTSVLLYGLGFEYNSLNSVVLPSQGFYLRSSINTGSRKLTNASANSNLLEGEMLAKCFIPFYENRLVLAFTSNSRIRTLYRSGSSSKLYENEMYRIGGMITIRGFNQEAVLSTAYSISTAEVYLRVSEGSGFFLFADKAFVKSYELGFRKDSWPLGLGVGLNLVTKAGLFNLSYAVGEGFGQSIGFKDAKVHFGIATIF